MGINELIKIGQRVKQIRVSKKISQRSLAASLGVPVSTLANYEADRRELPAELICKIAEILDCNISDILPEMAYHTQEGYFYFFDFAKEEKERKEKLLSYFSQLNEEGQLEAIKRIEELSELEKYKKVDDGEE